MTLWWPEYGVIFDFLDSVRFRAFEGLILVGPTVKTKMAYFEAIHVLPKP